MNRTSGNYNGYNDTYYGSSNSNGNYKRGSGDRDDDRDRPYQKKLHYTSPAPFISRPKADHQLSTMNKKEAPYLEWIATWQKTAEGRVNGDFYRSYKEGHTVCMHNFREYVLCKITYLHKYPSFKDMIEGEGLRNLLPTTKTIEEGVRIYESFPGANRVKALGALAIGVEPIVRYLTSEGREIKCERKKEEKAVEEKELKKDEQSNVKPAEKKE